MLAKAWGLKLAPALEMLARRPLIRSRQSPRLPLG
jgi:hypothetical protein